MVIMFMNEDLKDSNVSCSCDLLIFCGVSLINIHMQLWECWKCGHTARTYLHVMVGQTMEML
jgi:ribosomal protein S27AE